MVFSSESLFFGAITEERRGSLLSGGGGGGGGDDLGKKNAKKRERGKQIDLPFLTEAAAAAAWKFTAALSAFRQGEFIIAGGDTDFLRRHRCFV